MERARISNTSSFFFFFPGMVSEVADDEKAGS